MKKKCSLVVKFLLSPFDVISTFSSFPHQKHKPEAVNKQSIVIEDKNNMGGEVVEEEIPIEGSWTPTLVIGTILFVAWISYGEGDFPVRVRRWCKLQVSLNSFSFIIFYPIGANLIVYLV